MHELEKHFNEWSDHYDNDIWSAYFKKVYKIVIEEYSRILQKKNVILDIGCGTGELERRLIKNYSNLEITAVDISISMLKQAKIKNGDSVRFIHGDIEKQYFDEDSFNTIFILNNLHHIQNIKKLLINFKIWLKAGGYIVIVDPFSDGFIRKPWTTLLKNLLIKEKGVTYQTVESIARMSKNIDLEIVRIRNIMYFSRLIIIKKHD